MRYKLKSAILGFICLGRFMVAAQADVTSILTPPGGSNGSVQYNNRGQFGGGTDLTYSTTTKKLISPAMGVSTLTFGNITYTPPPTQTGGYFLRTDGSGGLSWTTPSAVSISTGLSLGILDGTSVISPITSSITFQATQFIVTLQGATTAAVALNGSTVTLMGPLSVTNPVVLTGSNFSLNGSSVTLRGPDPALGGDLSGTISNAVLGTVDISGQTNLAVSAPITLTGDTIGIDKSSATLLGPAIEAAELPADGYAATYVNTTGDTMSGPLTIQSSVTVSGAGGAHVRYGLTTTTFTMTGSTMALAGVTYYLPTNAGSSGQALTTSGGNTVSTLSWVTPSAILTSATISNLYSSTITLANFPVNLPLYANALGQIQARAIRLDSSDTEGILPTDKGGTGQTLYTDGALLIGDSSTGRLSTGTLTAGTNITITNGNGSITINSGGGGGTPSLQISRSGVQVTSPTASLNFYSGDFLSSAVGATTAQVFLNPATTNYVWNTSALQSGATFYVSSGTVLGVLSASSITTTGRIDSGNDYAVRGSPVLAVKGLLGSSIFVGNGMGGGATIAPNNDTCVGYGSCPSISGDNNAMFGHNSGLGLTSGTHNTCVGHSSCETLSTSVQNTAVGSNALFSITSGSLDVALGYTAGSLLTTGANNTFIGTNAGSGTTTGNYNTFVGRGAGQGITTGTSNTCQGSTSCVGLVAGSSNTFIGADNSNGGDQSANTLLGYGAGAATGVTKSACIGYNCSVVSSNTMQLGGAGADAVKVVGSTFTFSSGAVNGPFIATTVSASTIAATLQIQANSAVILGPVRIDTSNLSLTGGAGIVSSAFNTTSSSMTVNGTGGLNVTFGVVASSFAVSSGAVSGQLTAGTVQGAGLATCGDGTHALSWGSGLFGCQALSSGSGGGTSLLAVATGTSTGFTGVKSSPTAVINLDGSQFNATLAGSATAFITIAYSTSVATGSLTLNSTHTFVSFNCAAACTATLPTAVGISGKKYQIKMINTAPTQVTVATTSSQTIDGALTQVLWIQYTALDVISDGSNWSIL